MSPSPCRGAISTLLASLEQLVERTSAGNVDCAEQIASRLASDLTALPAPLVPLLMDTWFYLRQNRCDLALEYAERAREAVRTWRS